MRPSKLGTNMRYLAKGMARASAMNGLIKRACVPSVSELREAVRVLDELGATPGQRAMALREFVYAYLVETQELFAPRSARGAAC